MKKSLFLLAAALLLPLSQAWADSYNAKLVVAVASKSPTGSGTVYASDKSSATSGESSVTKNGGSSGASVTLYAYSAPADGYELVGWSANADGSSIIGDSKKNPYGDSYTCHATKNQTITYNRYAVFQEITYPGFEITYSAPVNGSYTVDGTSVGSGGLSSGTKTKIYKPTLIVTAASSGYAFNGWYQDGSKVSSSATYTPSYTASHTVSPQFVQATVVTTLDALKTSVQSNPLTEVPSGTTIVIPKGDSVMVGTDKTLIVNGTIWVEGAFDGSAGSVTVGGAVRKVVKSIVQSEPIIPANAYTTYPSYKYCTTQISSVTSATVSGCTTSYGVLVGGKHYAIDAADPNALKVTFDTTKAVNSIASVENATVSKITENGSYLLLKDTSMTGPVTTEDSKYPRINFQGTVDCAGSKCTVSGNQVGRTYNAVVANGSFEYNQSSYYWQCGQVKFVNCSSATVKKIKYVSNNIFYFYDCGTVEKPMSLTMTYYSSARGTDRRFAYYYSGCFNYTFNSTDDGSGLSQVYGGVFTSDPNAYLAKSTLIAKQSSDHNNYYLVREKQPGDDVIMIGDVGYTSLQAAIDAASSGARLKVNNAIVLASKVTIASGKNLTIDLNGLTISGGSIENAGALRLEDASNGETKGTLSSPVTNTGSGSIDVNGGIYAGSFAINGGTMTTHTGSFTSTFSVTKGGSGAYHLLGGYFANNVTALLDSGYRQVSGKVGYYFQGSMVESSIGSAQIGYKVKMLSPDSDYALYQKYLKGDQSGSKYDTVAAWDRVVEIASAVQPYEGYHLDCTLSFDRNVAANTITGYGMALGTTKDLTVDKAINVGETYRILRPIFQQYGGGDKAYKYFFIEDNMQNIGFGVANKSTALDNIGTTCTMAMRLFDDYAGDVEVLCIASHTYKFKGKGAIAGSTDYTSLQAAVDAVADGATVRLSLDSSAAVTVSAMKTFVLDNNNFAFTGSVSAGTGYKLAETTDLGDGKTQYRFIATHTVAVPAVAHATVSVAVGGTVVGTQAGNYTVDHGQKVVVTYVPETGYDLATKTVTYESVTENKSVPEQEPTAIPYAITYELNGGVNHPDNPATYTIEDEVTLKAPTRTGHFFMGWAEGDMIPAGSTGAKIFTATWKKSSTFFVK